MQVTVKVTQVYRVKRTVKILLGAESVASAKEQVSSDLPPFDDPIWSSSWDLQGEEVTAEVGEPHAL